MILPAKLKTNKNRLNAFITDFAVIFLQKCQELTILCVHCGSLCSKKTRKKRNTKNTKNHNGHKESWTVKEIIIFQLLIRIKIMSEKNQIFRNNHSFAAQYSINITNQPL